MCAPQPQTGATYAAKIANTETRIDFGRPAREVHDHIRGLSPVPGAWFAAGGAGERIRVLRSSVTEGEGPAGTVLDAALTVACATGAVQLLELQRAGRKPMPAAEFLHGYALPPGMRL
jgi:methionyl-tRNA formyltransferase